jgi:hypothetical protein
MSETQEKKKDKIFRHQRQSSSTLEDRLVEIHKIKKSTGLAGFKILDIK